MDMWMDYQSKAVDREAAQREYHMRELAGRAPNVRTLRRRTAFYTGLMLMRWSRRLLAYGKPAVDHSVALRPERLAGRSKA